MKGDASTELHLSASVQSVWRPRLVTFVTPGWSRDGGLGAHVQASAMLLASHCIRVRVVAAKIEGSSPDPLISLVRDPAAVAVARTATALAEALSGLPSDVIHVHHLYGPARIATLKKLAPVVMSEHAYSMCASGVHYFQPGEECSRAHGPGCTLGLLGGGCAHTRYPRTLPRRYLAAGLAQRTLRAADEVVCYSGAVARHLAVNGVQSCSLVPLFPTLPAGEVPPKAAERRVLFAGRAVEAKGLDILIEAMRAVDGELHVCSEGREIEPMRALARRLGIDARIHFRGWLSPSELRRELATSALLALPSTWPEPFGLIGIEALALGCPVVATDCGGVRDWLEDGRNGLLVPAGDPGRLAEAITELLDDPARRLKMGESGRAMVGQRFSAQRHLHGLLNAYRKAVESRAQPE